MNARVLLIALLAIAGSSVPASATVPPLGFALLETITVPTDGSSVVSTTALTSGVTYLLRASGTFTIATPPCPLADAEFARFESNNTCVLPGTPQDFVGAYDIGIGVNSPIVNNSKGITWSTVFHPSHRYTVGFVGAGAPISLNYHDTLYTDNVGTLTVEIFAPAAVATIPALGQLGLVLLVLGVMLIAYRQYRI